MDSQQSSSEHVSDTPKTVVDVLQLPDGNHEGDTLERIKDWNENSGDWAETGTGLDFQPSIGLDSQPQIERGLEYQTDYSYGCLMKKWSL